MGKIVKNTNNYFFLLLAVTIIVLIINLAIGQKQDKVYIQDGNKLIQAEKYLKEEKYSQAEPLLAELTVTHPESYQLQWYYGRCLANKGDYTGAKKYYDLAREIAPLVVRDTSFLVGLGEIEFKLSNYDTADRYLQVAKLINQQGRLTESDQKKYEAIIERLRELK